jgi:hypothetical protein
MLGLATFMRKTETTQSQTAWVSNGKQTRSLLASTEASFRYYDQPPRQWPNLLYPEAVALSRDLLTRPVAIEDALDAAEDRIAAEQRAEPALARYRKDLSEIVSALPAELVPTALAGPLDAVKPFLKTVSWLLRKTADGRQRYRRSRCAGGEMAQGSIYPP